MPQTPSAPPPPPLPAGSADVSVHFFRNYNRVIILAYAAILLGLLAFFANQLYEKLDAEISAIQANVQRYSQFVEFFVIRSSADHLDALRMMVQDAAAPRQARRSAASPEWPRFTVRQTAGATHYSLDEAPDWDMTGNLVGVGPLERRSAAFYHDLDLALILNRGFRSLGFILPNAARTRFISTHDFVLTFPWKSSANQPFTPAVYQEPVWTLGQPEPNPDHEKYWAPIYFGGPDQGLLAPVAVPVYDAQRFAGIIAIDLSVDYLNRINASFGYPLGLTLLADAYNQVLAHPGWYADPLKVEQAPLLPDVLPDALKPYVLDNLPQDQPLNLQDYLVIGHRFTSAPWVLLYTVPRSALWHKILMDYGPPMLATLLGLAAVMFITYLVTSREFVGPAAKLVRHLAAESRFQPAHIPMVPMAWRPWFETVTKAFRESIQLMVLRQELDVAAKMQLAILPQAWPAHAEYQLWGTMRPAREVGGDFYDHFEVAGGLRGVTVADVSGKGIGPGLFGMMAKTLLRVTAMHGQSSLPEVIGQVNDELCEDNDSCMFVTLFYGLFDPATGELLYVNGGHPPPLLVHADGEVEYLPVLGGVAPGIIPGAPYPPGRMPLRPGDTLLMFSDGVTEAMSATHEEFGPDRLAELFRGKPATTPNEAVERTIRAVQAFAAGVEQSDDITCVALCYQPQAGHLPDHGEPLPEVTT